MLEIKNFRIDQVYDPPMLKDDLEATIDIEIINTCCEIFKSILS